MWSKKIKYIYKEEVFFCLRITPVLASEQDVMNIEQPKTPSPPPPVTTKKPDKSNSDNSKIIDSDEELLTCEEDMQCNKYEDLKYRDAAILNEL